MNFWEMTEEERREHNAQMEAERQRIAKIERLIAERVKPDSPMLSAIDTPPVRIRCIEYSQRRSCCTDKVVHHWRNLRHVGGPLYVSGPITNRESHNAYYDLYLRYDGGNNAIKWQGYSVPAYAADKTTTDELVASLDVRYKMATLSDYIADLDKREQTRFVDLASIEFVRQFDAERAERYAVSRAAWWEKKKIIDVERKQKREAEDAAYVESQNAKVYAICSAAVEAIRNGGTVENSIVTWYKSRYDYAEYCLVNFLLNHYGVDAPIRTKGWIAAHIDSLTFAGGHISGGKWHTKKATDKIPDGFRIAMQKLIRAVQDSAVPA